MRFLERLFRLRDDPRSQAVKPFLEHLEDLRWMLIKMVITLAVGMTVSFLFRVELVRVLQKPLHDLDPQLVSNLQVFGVMDSLLISLRLAFYAGIVITFPLLLFFLAQFVLPALTLKEKKFLIPGILIGFALFSIGVCASYFLVLPRTLEFCYNDARSLDWTLRPPANYYFSFVTNMTLALGLAFELPVVVLALNYLGFLSVALMRRTRIYAIPLLFVLAAVIAPTPDPFTLFAFAVPLCLLYEGCIWAAWLFERRRTVAASLPAETA
jgi:sec-independent protein translocase protein TatC